MNKVLKISLWVVGTVVVLLVVAVAIFAATFDADKYKDEISALVKKTTGRDLAINGTIDLSFFPWLGVAVSKMELGNAPGFGPAAFAKLDVAEIHIEVLPLFRGAISTDTVTLRGLAVELAKDASGKTNWADLAGETAPEPPQKEQEPQGKSAVALAIGGVNIVDSRLVWDDRQAGQRFVIDNLSLQTGAIEQEKPVDIKLGFDVASQPETIAGNLRLTARVEIDESLQQFRLTGVMVSADLRGESLPGKHLTADIGADIDADMQTQRLVVANLVVQAFGASVQGRLDAEKFIDAPAYQGELKVSVAEPRKTLQQLEVPIETADPGTLQNITLDTEFNGTTERITFTRLNGNLDKTALDGTLAIEDFAKQSLRFKLAIDDIDVDRYLPPVKEPVAGTPATTPATAAAAGADELPLDMLRKLDIDGGLTIGTLKISNMRSSDMAVTVKAKDGVIRLHPLTATLYSGKYSGDIQADARGDVLVLSLNEKLTGVQAAPLLKDMIDNDPVSGQANVEAKVTLRGATPDQARRTINGTAAFSFANGAIKGVNVAKMIRDAKALFDKRKPSEEPEQLMTDFSELTGTLQIADGLVRNEDLSVKAPLLRVAGSGSVNLVSEAVDYLTKVKIVGTTKGQAGKELDALKGLTIPLRVKGTISKPEFDVELDEALKEKAKERVEELTAEEKAKLEQKKTEAQQRLEQEREQLKQETEQQRDELKDKAREKLKKLF